MKNLLSKLKPELLDMVRSIGLLAEERGMLAFLVGGPVRDLMLGVPNVDLDITVEGNGIRLAEAFERPYLIVYIQCNLKEALERNSHNVPVNTLLQMQANLITDIVPSSWKQEIIFNSCSEL